MTHETSPAKRCIDPDESPVWWAILRSSSPEIYKAIACEHCAVLRSAVSTFTGTFLVFQKSMALYDSPEVKGKKRDGRSEVNSFDAQAA